MAKKKSYRDPLDPSLCMIIEGHIVRPYKKPVDNSPKANYLILRYGKNNFLDADITDTLDYHGEPVEGLTCKNIQNMGFLRLKHSKIKELQDQTGNKTISRDIIYQVHKVFYDKEGKTVEYHG